MKINFRVFLASILALMLTAATFANAQERDPSQFVVRGNQAYEKGDFLQSVEDYLKAIDSGANNAHTYYNLANAYFRLGQIGHAIVNYRRSLLQSPRDPDLRVNLELARRKVQDRFETVDSPTSVMTATLLFLNRSLSAHEMFLTGLAVYLLFWVLFILDGLFPRTLTRLGLVASGVVLLFLVCISYFSGYDRLGEPKLAVSADERAKRGGVISVSEAKVRSGNSDTFQVIALLHDGAEVEVGEIRDEWIQIFLPEGRAGWVKMGEIGVI